MSSLNPRTYRSLTLLMIVALVMSTLSSCELAESPGIEQSTKPQRVQAAIKQLRAGKGSVEFPEALRGEWMMGPEPCYLPLNQDADGQLTITADRMYGYEDTYELVSVTAEPARRNTWAVVTAEHLGDQLFEMKHDLILDGSKLMATHGKEYRVTYVRCVEKNDD